MMDANDEINYSSDYLDKLCAKCGHSFIQHVSIYVKCEGCVNDTTTEYRDCCKMQFSEFANSFEQAVYDAKHNQ